MKTMSLRVTMFFALTALAFAAPTVDMSERYHHVIRRLQEVRGKITDETILQHINMFEAEDKCDECKPISKATIKLMIEDPLLSRETKLYFEHPTKVTNPLHRRLMRFKDAKNEKIKTQAAKGTFGEYVVDGDTWTWDDFDADKKDLKKRFGRGRTVREVSATRKDGKKRAYAQVDGVDYEDATKKSCVTKSKYCCRLKYSVHNHNIKVLFGDAVGCSSKSKGKPKGPDLSTLTWDTKNNALGVLSKGNLHFERTTGGDSKGYAIGTVKMAPKTGVYEWGVTVYSTGGSANGKPYAQYLSIGIAPGPTTSEYGVNQYAVVTYPGEVRCGTKAVPNKANSSCGTTHAKWNVPNKEQVNVKYDSDTNKVSFTSVQGISFTLTVETNTYFAWCQPYWSSKDNACEITCRGTGCFKNGKAD